MTLRSYYIMFIIALLGISPISGADIPKAGEKWVWKEVLNTATKEVNVDKILKGQERRFREIEKRAAKDADYLAALAEHYFMGFYVKKNRRTGLRLYREAAAKGSALATFRIGELMMSGSDFDNNGSFEVPKNREKGLEMMNSSAPLLKRLAGKSHGEAQFLVGTFHEDGRFGFDLSPKKAIDFFRRSANQGDPRGFYASAKHSKESGKNASRIKADLYHNSAILDYGPAAAKLGELYERGIGRPKDIYKARVWYQMGVYQRDIESAVKEVSYLAKQIEDRDSEDEDLLWGWARVDESTMDVISEAVKNNDARGFEALAIAGGKFRAAHFYLRAIFSDPSNRRYWEAFNRRLEKEKAGLYPGVYTASKINEMRKLAARTGNYAYAWVKEVARLGYLTGDAMDKLPSISDLAEGSSTLFFTKDSGLVATHRNHFVDFQYSYNQPVISYWEVRTGKLHSIQALPPGSRMVSLAEDKKTALLYVDRDARFMPETELGGLYIYDLSDGTFRMLDKHSYSVESEFKAYKDNAFSGGGRYVSYTEKREDRDYWENFLYDLESEDRDGFQNYFIDSGDLHRIISPNGLHSITESREASNYSYSHERVPFYNDSIPLGEAGKALYNDGFFTSDGRYLVGGGYAFDLVARKLGDIGGEKPLGKLEAVGKHGIILNCGDTDFGLYFFTGDALIELSRSPYDVPLWKTMDHTIADDHSMMAIAGYRENSTEIGLFFQPLNLPSQNEIEDIVYKANSQDVIDDALAMFEAGFGEIAVDKYISLVQDDRLSDQSIQALLGKRSMIGGQVLSSILVASIETAYKNKEKVITGYSLSNRKSGGVEGLFVEGFDVGGSRAEAAGLLVGDRVLHVNGRTVDDSNWVIVKRYLDGLEVGERVVISVERGGDELSFSYEIAEAISERGVSQIIERLFLYGLLGNACGHPSIASEAALKIESIRKTEALDRLARGGSGWAAVASKLLNAVASAKENDLESAYRVLLSEVGLKAEDSWGSNQITKYPDLFMDLFHDPKKLAYIMGKTQETLPSLPKATIETSSFTTLDGRLLNAESALKKNELGGSIIE